MGNKKHADEDNTHLYLFKMKVMHDKQCLLSCINLRRPGTMDSTVQLIILMGEKGENTSPERLLVSTVYSSNWNDNKTHPVECKLLQWTKERCFFGCEG